jgi:hypothetical protein
MATGGYFGAPGFDPTFEPTGLPSYGLGISPYSSLPSGGTGGLGGGTGAGVSWGPLLAAGLGAAGGLVGSNAGAGVLSGVQGVQQQAQLLGKQGQGLVGLGSEALSPAIAYFRQLLSGNPADLLAATAPERGRVLDQYDSARQAIANFSPRGGGVTSALNESRVKEASDLSTLTSNVRPQAAQALGSLGQSTTQTGLSAEEASVQALSQVLGPLLQQEGQDTQQVASTFASIGLALAMAA